MEFIAKRLKEPSTYAGLAGVLGGMSFIPNAAEWAQVVMQVGALVSAVMAILIPEKKS